MDREMIDKTIEYVKSELSGEATGHDWWHVQRVWKNAKLIGAREKANTFIVDMAALLHDIADWKFADGDDDAGPNKAREWLLPLGASTEDVDHIASIIKELSFKGAGVKSEMSTLEGKVVQDADRLDALGAIGIARCFAYGGHKNREIYNPEIKPELHQSFEQYKKNDSSSVNHFYEKLLLLKDLMNTETARALADDRHKFMETYLERFYKEWNGEA